jgi:hypothetical protein
MQPIQVKYLVNSEIDKVKWDACISKAFNGVIYGYSFYLDHMADQWDGLVLNDYEAVMPLPWRKKYGIKYAYQPFFTAQGGVFFTQTLSSEVIEKFINTIPGAFRYLSLHLNEMLHFLPSTRYKLLNRTNYVLFLHQQYEALYKNYTEDAKKNLRRAEKFQTIIQPFDDVSAVIALYRQQYGKLNNKIDDECYSRLQKLVQYLLQKKMALCYQVLLNNETVAAAIFLKDNKRLYYILGAPTTKGRETKAVHILIDFIIKSHACSELALDFEGSDIGSVADFYIKFGPQKKTYQQFIYNRLPFILRWLKQ